VSASVGGIAPEGGGVVLDAALCCRMVNSPWQQLHTSSFVMPLLLLPTCPSGSSNVFSSAELDCAVAISCSKSSATYDRSSLISRTISRSAVVVNE
jgi:hypothetical protein